MRKSILALGFWLGLTAHALAALGFHGTPAAGVISGAATNTVSSTTFTTTVTDTVIMAVVGTSAGGLGGGPFTVSSISGGGLTWTRRNGQTAANSFGQQGNQEVWYAIASSTFSATVTATLSGSSGAGYIAVFAFSGANTSTPFDVNGALPVQNANMTAVANAVTGNVSTTNADTAIFAFITNTSGSQTDWTPNASYTTIGNVNAFSGGPNFIQLYAEGQYRIVTSAQSSVAVAFTPNSANYYYYIDAIQAAPVAGGVTSRGMLLGVGQ